MAKGREGQLTIFLGVTLVSVITLIAFIVNVGLFVKAKINLQNAVDAAAWSGAAVQARQLSNIAYLNYQFRQIYKEWMFKYYILGNLAALRNAPNPGGTLTLARRAGSTTNFRARNLGSIRGQGSDRVVDKYNMPSICINPACPNQNSCPNICATVSTPGIPRFEHDLGLAGITKEHESFVSALAAQKAKDCSLRSNLNIATALAWTYGAGDGSEIVKDFPLVDTTRMGSWVWSALTAIRMRNLEAIVNHPPDCINRTGADGCMSIGEIIQSPPEEPPYYERPAKAFMAAYRNLGGGINKEGVGGDREELSDDFTLTELTPRSKEVDPADLGGFLIPGGSDRGKTKRYLDLRAVPVNYVIFYSYMASLPPSQSAIANSVTPDDAGCEAVKTALPVPAYVTGFVKDHRMLTYYSVKGESRFMGLFFPFYKSLGEGIRLKAYASAKPFGGRIGPRLFHLRDEAAVSLREASGSGATAAKSAAYASGIGGLEPDKFEGGALLPNVRNFYLGGDDQVIGGVPDGNNTQILFAIPNMIYDFLRLGEIGGIAESAIGNSAGNRYLSLDEMPLGRYPADGPVPKETRVGLYDWNQFKYLYDMTLGDVIGNPGGAVNIGAGDVKEAIELAWKPTKYEAANWMPPLEIAGDEMASPTTVITDPNLPGTYKIYAPLYGPGTLYENQSAVREAIEGYMRANFPSYNAVLDALKTAAEKTLAHDPDKYKEAAEKIYPLVDDPSGRPVVAEGGSMDSGGIFACGGDSGPMASQFFQFFRVDDSPGDCGTVALAEKLRRLFSAPSSNAALDREYFIGTHRQPIVDDPKTLSTAYSPGLAHGADDQANFRSPLSGDSMNFKRNYYSTKFIHTQNLLPGEDFYGSRGLLFQEESTSPSPAIASGLLPGPLDNPLEVDIGEFRLNSAAALLSGQWGY